MSRLMDDYEGSGESFQPHVEVGSEHEMPWVGDDVLVQQLWRLAAKATIRLLLEEMPNFISESFQANYEAHLERFRFELYSNNPVHDWHTIQGGSHALLDIFLGQHQSTEVMRNIRQRIGFQGLLKATQKLYDEYKSMGDVMPIFAVACAIMMHWHGKQIED